MRGHTLLELLVVVALIGIFAVLFTGDVRSSVRTQEFENFARETGFLLEKCRLEALNQRRYAGVVIGRHNGQYTISLHLDGNDNGIRQSDVDRGIDRLFHGPISMHRASNDIAPAILSSEVPQIPPRKGAIESYEDPVKFGKSNIISFSPYGDSSSGTLYLGCRSLHEMYGLVLYGPTARLNLWRYRNFRWQMVEDR